MNIYANGCSFVMGQELVDSDPLNMDNKRTAWPVLIGAYNDAWSGSSNHAIANRTLNYCRENPVDVAIIGWSHHSRVLTLGQNYRNDRLGQHVAKPGSTKTEEWYKRHYHNEDMLIEWNQNVIESTYYWLESHDIKPIFFNSLNKFVTDVPMLWECDSWRSVYHSKHNLKINYEKHPDQKSHDWLANYLQELLLFYM